MDYLLKSTICLTAFYGLYFYGFRRMSFHTLNRFYLLVSLALSLTIPFLSYERTEVVMLEPQPIEEVSIPVEEMQESAYNQASAIQQPTSVEEVADTTINWIPILNTIYLLGVVLMFFVFFKNLMTILYTIKKASVSEAPASLASCGTTPATAASTSLSHRRSNRKLKILVTRSQSNSSFFNYIFLNPDNLNPHEETLIIAHEGFHVQRLHTLDLITLGILKAAFWFNPIVYFYQKSLKQIHEYEVDALMSATYDGREYAHLLLKLGVAPSAVIINQFSTKPLSERIQFLFKTPTKNMKKLLYFLSLPLIAVGVMAFAEKKIVRVYQENQTNKVLQESMPTQSPLKIFYKNAQDKNVPSLILFSERNLTVNDLFLLPAATYYYVNPNFLTIEGIQEVNTKLKDKGYSIIVNEQEKDSENNLTKLTLFIKNLKTQKTTQAREIDMVHAREVGKKGAWLFFEIYKNHFQDSDVILTEGTSDLEINVGEKIGTTYVNITSNLRISKGEIVYKVSPDKLNLKTFEKVKEYFAKEGFTLQSKNEVFDGKNNLISLTILINKGKEKVEKQIILNDLRHLVKSKNIKTARTQRADESIVIEANKETQEVKISYDNRWFDLFRKSGNYEVLKVTNNIIMLKIDSSRFSFNTNIKVPKNKVDSFNVIANQEYLVEGKDYIVKNNIIFLNPIYKNNNIKIAYHLFMKPLGSIIYPELIKLNKVTFPDMRFSSKTPVFLTKNDNNSLLQTSKSPSYFSKVARNQDTLRTVFETNKLGKNPLVIINRVEYPSSILYRINPEAIESQDISSQKDKNTVLLYGEKAKDGCIEITTKKGVDIFLKNDEKRKSILENVAKQVQESKKRVKREVLKNRNYERISIISLDGSSAQFSVDIPIGEQALFILNGKIVSEADIDTSNQKFISGGCGKIGGSNAADLIITFGESIKQYDSYFMLNTK